MRSILLIVATLALAGCAAKYDQVSLATPDTKLSKDGPVIIATPANGFYETKEYRTSGKMTAVAVKAAFARQASKTQIAPDCKTLECLKENYPTNYQYYVVPEILHWEDRATEWSGIPDKIEVQLTIYEQGNWQEIASTLIKGKSKWATFGGDHPQDLLPEPLNNFVESLY